VTQQANIA